MQIAKTAEFDAAHRLFGYRGKCANIHGHRWRVEVVVEGDVEENGIVLDFFILKCLLQRQVVDRYDHCLLLAVDDPLVSILVAYFGADEDGYAEGIYVLKGSPTCEVLADQIFLDLQREIDNVNGRCLVGVRSVTVWETPTACATRTRV